LERVKGRDNSEDLGVDGSKVLKCMLWKEDREGVEWTLVPQVLLTGSSEHCNEPSGSIKRLEFLDYVNVLSVSQERPCSI
jgi:hypothetical protein